MKSLDRVLTIEKNIKMKKFLTILLTITTLLFTACEKETGVILPETEGKATVTFDAVFGNQDFAINKDFTSGTKTFNFTKFRYWVSNVSLINAKGQEVKIPNSYYLVEETGAINLVGLNNDNATTIYPATKREDVVLKEIPADDYKTIKFSIGVEQKYNDNMSLQAGELSQLNGMTNVSWMWLTSYIFTSATGKVTEAGATKNIQVETGLNANYKSISLDFPATLHIGSNKSTSIVLTTDVAKALDGIDIITNPVIGASKATIMAAVATNYATKVFTVKSAN